MTLRAGDTAPDFTLPTAVGGAVSLSEVLQDSPVVLVFFPLAFSGRCQGELCEIRDNIAMFQDAAVKVIGISVDSHHALRAWGEQQEYSFDLASDFWPHGEVAGAYGVFLHDKGFATRASFLIDQAGAVVWSVINDPGTSRSLDAYREALTRL